MSGVFNFIIGILIGFGAILPGVSSGVFCVIFGIYEKLVDSVLNLFKDFKKNFAFLFPIGLGAFFGIVLFGNVIKYLLFKFPIQTKSVFIGLILGSIPSLIKEINTKTSFKSHYLIYSILAFIIGIASVILEKYVSNSFSANNFSYIYLIFSGLIMSIGIIVPGVSSTIILMLMGVYSTYLSSVSYLYFPVLIPMGIGLIIGCLICMKTTKFLLDHFYAQTFYSIIGFTLGSTFVLLPNISFDLSGLLCILCILLGIYLFKIFNHS